MSDIDPSTLIPPTLLIRIEEHEVVLAAVENGATLLEDRWPLPPGQTLTLERAVRRAAAYGPSFIGLEQDGIHTRMYEFVMKARVDIQKRLWGHVVILDDLRRLQADEDELRAWFSEHAPPGVEVIVRRFP